MLALLLILSLFPYPSISFINSDGSLAFGKLFAASCEFSTFVSRSRRSVELSDDPAEMFEYLFPLAKVKPEEFMAGGGRSNSVPSLSSYFDDVVELWHEECAERRKEDEAKERRRQSRRKRSQVRNQGVVLTDSTSYDRLGEPAGDTWTGYLGNLSATWYSFMPDVPTFDDDTEVKYVQEGDEIVEYLDEHENKGYEIEEVEEEETDAEDSESDDDDDDNEEDGGSKKSSSTKKKKKEGITTTEATTTTTKATPSAPSGIPSIAEQDPNFASYGGDIEYVFPILTTTIPFDGEITVLGFHGFKGMFIY